MTDDCVDLFLLDLGVTIKNVSSCLYTLEKSFFKTVLAFSICLSDILPLGNGNKWSNQATDR